MDDLFSKPFERTAGPVYFLAALFLGLSLLDYVMNVWPLNPGALNWRYGALGLSGGFLLTPLLGLLMLLVGSILYDHRGVRLTTGALSAVLSVGLLLGLMLFVLDSLQVRRTVAAKDTVVFDAGVIKAVIKMLTGAICSGWIGLVSLRGLPGGSKARRSEARPLVVGASEGGSKAPGARG